MAEGEHQVIIVGAGPAGSTAALLLARRGLEVALLDRACFPRPKACGECLSAEATVVLRRLDLLETVLAEEPAHLRGWRIVAPSGHAFQALFPDTDGAPTTALALDRRRLDAALVRAAVAAGARLHRFTVGDLLIREGRVAGVEGRGQDGARARMRGQVVIGADGLRSVVARRLGLAHGGWATLPRSRLRGRTGRRLGPRKLSLTTHVANPGMDWPTSQGLGEMHLAPGACLGVAPVDTEGRCLNLSLVVNRGRALRGVDARGFFKARLREFPGLQGRRGDLRVDGELLASGPFRVPTRDVVADGAALVGDAAGYFDPFTGQGVFRALAGAELLAPVLADALACGVPDARTLRPYSERYRALVRWPRRVQQVIDWVVTRPRLADAAIARLARIPELAEALVAVTGDLRPAGTLVSARHLLSLVRPPLAPSGLP